MKGPVPPVVLGRSSLWFRYSRSPPGLYLSSVERYSVDLDNWRPVAPLLMERCGMGAAALAGPRPPAPSPPPLYPCHHVPHSCVYVCPHPCPHLSAPHIDAACMRNGDPWHWLGVRGVQCDQVLSALMDPGVSVTVLKGSCMWWGASTGAAELLWRYLAC